MHIGKFIHNAFSGLKICMYPFIYLKDNMRIVYYNNNKIHLKLHLTTEFLRKLELRFEKQFINRVLVHTAEFATKYPVYLVTFKLR